ncbi:hypothetical protein P170DRAFT_510964 [Aspergillus steynii IBT 23096]|uniref:Aminoglycoside phosphotransferase domain-containing protein n=1 Tax=Aspergillus steynii IBT 23096 TaxID=1392250 RepID=A0A2I2G633_9EURO|nr:uncharacterized protein P170DRAFT_510964 [Aspergillus steynii IBT 23096]PLB48335.1 hypothetical protein P170DRAFT_510964 [Aspergillus steynii IBT 23096]
MENASSVTATSVSNILITAVLTWQDGAPYDSAAREAEEKEITRLLESLDLSALLSRASDLRNGIACSTPQPLVYDRSTRSSVMGGMNYHVEINFEDGVQWLARIRRSNATSPPLDLRDYIMQSEVATLQFLGKTKVPAPKVFDYGLHGQTPIGVGYILMEKLPGKSLRWSLASPEQRRKVMTQLADIYIELESFPFDVMGSLGQPATDHIGPFARESLTEYIDSRMVPLGPYNNPRDYLRSSIELNMRLITKGESYAEREIDAYLVHRFLVDCIPDVLVSHGFDDGRFYLRHADDKGDHLLIDDGYNITGIVDWEWAYTDSKSAAFKSPMMLLPVADFYNGVNDTGEDELTFAAILEEKGNTGLAEIVRNGRLLHRFQFCCGYDFSDWEGFLGLFQGLRDGLGRDAHLGWEDWRQVALRRYAGDEQLEMLLGRTG